MHQRDVLSAADWQVVFRVIKDHFLNALERPAVHTQHIAIVLGASVDLQMHRLLVVPVTMKAAIEYTYTLIVAQGSTWQVVHSIVEVSDKSGPRTRQVCCHHRYATH